MKYTIEGFSQAKLHEMKLNASDALILRWFLDFAACGRMKRLVQENENHEKNVYYWVNYQAIIEELPILEITNTKSIANRFNKYVELGLLEKIVHSGGANGLQTFYAITEKCLELEYSTVPAAEKIKHQESEVKSKETKNLTVNKNNSDNQSESIQKDTVTPIIHGLESNFQSVTEWNQTSSPEVGLESNFQSGLESNFQSVYINSSTKNSSITLSNPSAEEKSERETVLTNAVKDFFEGSLALFSDDLIPKLVKLTAELDVSKLQPYVKYTWLLIKSQKPSKPHGMFYKFILQSNTLDSFITSLAGSNVKSYTKWTCPICSSKNSITDDCPVCDVQYSLRNDPKHLFIKRQLFELPEGRRRLFKEELTEITHDGDFKSYNTKLHTLYQRFGIKEEDTCQTI